MAVFDWKNRRGSILLTSYIVLVVLLLFASLFFNRSVTDRRLFDINREQAEAFYLAEAGVDRALEGLRNDYSGYTGTSATGLGRGEYETSVTTLSGISKTILSCGYVPGKASPRAQRRIEVVTKKMTPPNFYDHALYAADDININGTSYSVSGKAIYADTPTGSLANICAGGVCGAAPTVTKNPTISPLARFDFTVLRNLASAQTNPNTFAGSNIYTPLDIAAGNRFPQNFWYQPPTDPADPTTGIPNIVYVEGSIEFKNSNTTSKTAGGFYIVVGTDPTVQFEDTGLGGNITVNGCIYTTGNFTNSGGGSNTDVNGGVWAGGDINLSGSIDITYDLNFMLAIKNVVEINGASGALQVLSWREV